MSFYVMKNFVLIKLKKKSTKQGVKLETIVILLVNIEVLLIVNANVQHKVPKNIPVAFHNGSSYDNHFVIKQLAKDFNGYFNCIGENTEKYISFSVTVLKERDTVNKKQKEKN